MLNLKTIERFYHNLVVCPIYLSVQFSYCKQTQVFLLVFFMSKLFCFHSCENFFLTSVEREGGEGE